MRCQQAGTLCITSGTRPLGRPRTNPTPAAVPGVTISRARPPRLRHNLTSLLSPTHAKQRPRGPETAVLTNLTPEVLGWLPHTTMDMTSDYGNHDYVLITKYKTSPYQPPDMPEATVDGLDHLFDVLVAESDLTVSLPNDGDSRNGNPSLDLGVDDTQYDDLLRTTDTSLPGYASTFGDLQHDAVAGVSLSSVSRTHQRPRWGISISRLNEELGQQLAHIELRPCKTSSSKPLCFAEISSSTENPITKAVQSTTSFVAILKSLLPLEGDLPETRPASDSNISMVCTGTRSTICPLGIVTCLLLLFIYLQLIQLYNAMFSHMTQVLGHVTRDTMGKFHPRPEFRIAWLPAMPSRLYIKILMEIIEHQFEGVESLMGLPDECRISPRSTSPGGVSMMEMS